MPPKGHRLEPWVGCATPSRYPTVATCLAGLLPGPSDEEQVSAIGLEHSRRNTAAHPSDTEPRARRRSKSEPAARSVAASSFSQAYTSLSRCRGARTGRKLACDRVMPIQDLCGLGCAAPLEHFLQAIGLGMIKLSRSLRSGPRCVADVLKERYGHTITASSANAARHPSAL